MHVAQNSSLLLLAVGDSKQMIINALVAPPLSLGFRDTLVGPAHHRPFTDENSTSRHPDRSEGSMAFTRESPTSRHPERSEGSMHFTLHPIAPSLVQSLSSPKNGAIPRNLLTCREK
jgi:hypothetical protein